jgi:hypothetical protein
VYPEFRAAPPSGERPLADPAVDTAPPARRGPGLRHWQVLLSTGFGVGLLAAAALCRLLLTL